MALVRATHLVRAATALGAALTLVLASASVLAGERQSWGGDALPRAGPSATETGAARADRPRRPNILLITSDDQTDEEMRWMPFTRRLVGRQGVTATDFISPHPLCCPARAEILTGEYAQNNGVRDNFGPFGGWSRFVRAGNRPHQIGVWLHRAGYRTGFVGKTLNGYESAPTRMPGFDRWNPTTVGTYSYFGTTFFNDGHPRSFPDDYVADVVARYTHRYLRDFTSGRRPWFLWVSHVGPHVSINSSGVPGPPIPAPRHARLFRHVRPPSLARDSFDEKVIRDKPRPVRHHHVLSRRHVVHLFRARIRTLQAIDEANRSAVRQLRRSGELAHTVVVFASDNGFQLGEHRLLNKNFPYEESLQVPLLVRGPGLRAGRHLRRTVTVVDLAPTFLALAGVLHRVRSHGFTDGADIWPLLQGRGRAPDTQLIQAGSDNPRVIARYGWWWRGVRTRRWTYAHWWYGGNELYDRRADPFEQHNLAGRHRYRPVQAELRRRLDALRHCHGAAECRRSFGQVPGLDRVSRGASPP